MPEICEREFALYDTCFDRLIRVEYFKLIISFHVLNT